jgi:hypothetical protein
MPVLERLGDHESTREAGGAEDGELHSVLGLRIVFGTNSARWLRLTCRASPPTAGRREGRQYVHNVNFTPGVHAVNI